MTRAVLVLGASRGLGEAIAHDLARRGFLVGVGCRAAADAERVTRQIEGEGGQALSLQADVTDYASVEAAVAKLQAEASSIVGLVNNAGLIQPIARLAETDPVAWLRLVSVNLVGVYNGVRAVLPVMTEGAIVNLSSGAASTPMEGWSAYCSSKAGVAMLTRCLDHEHGASGLRAYGYRPGLVDTGMQEEIRASALNPVSKVDQSTLFSPAFAASAVGWLIAVRPDDLRGQELDIRDENFRRRVQPA